MSTYQRKAKAWKRAIVAVGAIVSLVVAFLMACVPDGDTFFLHTGKWLFTVFFGIGGIWFVIVAVRGDARQTDKTLDQMSSGL